MLSKINRLTKKNDFQQAFKKGRILEGELIWLKYKNNNTNSARAGFIVGLKVSKKATERNKIKRRLRSASRYFLKEISGYDIIIGAKPEIKKKKFAEIIYDLKNLFLKIK